MDRRTNFINKNMELIHNLCDDLYESLMDGDDSTSIIKSIQDILTDLNETFSDEI